MESGIRKSVRLSGYDYSQPGAYFVTVCTAEKQCILSSISVGAIHESPCVKLTDMGLVVEEKILLLPGRYPRISVDRYVIMPNHIHLLLTFAEDGAIHESPLRALLPTAVGFMKMNASKDIHRFAPAARLWQRGYYEHIIRGKEDYAARWRYIDENPARWADDEYCLPAI